MTAINKLRAMHQKEFRLVLWPVRYTSTSLSEEFCWMQYESFASQTVVIYRDIATRQNSKIYVMADVFSFSNASITSLLHDPVLLG